ncbi:MAG: glycosyltransferase family 4 protein [Actinomycetota bacterium]
MRRVIHLLGRSEGGIRRHVRYLAGHPPAGYETCAVVGPPELARFFAGLPFVERRGRAVPPVPPADVLHAHGLGAAAAALRGRTIGRARLVVTVHTSPDQTLLASFPPARIRAVQRLLWSAARLILARADAVVVVSQQMQGWVPGAQAIPPAVDLPAARRPRAEVRGELGAGDADVVVLAVGRLHPDKRLDLVIEGLHGTQAHGWIAGDGPERAHLERLAAGTSVGLLGHREDVADLLAAADVFALPASGEAYGLAVLEAVAAGLPVVATRVGAAPDIVGEAGVLAAPDDRAGFVRSLRQVVADRGLRDRLSAAAAARPLPSPEDLVARLGAVYDEGGRHGRRTSSAPHGRV